MSQMCPNCSTNNPDQASTCVQCGEPLRGLLGRHTVLGIRYRLLQVLGCGGMGAVYLADDHRIPGRRVAVKENLNLSPQAQSQFQSEVSMMVGLKHPGLPEVSDQFSDGTTRRQYLVMDYVEGETLEDIMAQRGPLSEKEVISLIGQLLDVLEHLHSRSVIHRDVKPANIKLRPNGKLVLVDFGLAKLHAAGRSTQTWARGHGSPGFAPIEQYGTGTDARSDLYSLGAVMYYLLTGHIPPEAPDLAAGTTTLTPPRQLRPDLSPHIQKVIFRAMAVNPEQRFQAAAEMRQALLTWANSTTDRSAPAPSNKTQAWFQPIVGHLPWLAITSGVGIVLILGVLLSSVLHETTTPGSATAHSPVASNTPQSDDTMTSVTVAAGLTLTPTPTNSPFSPSLITANNVARLADLAQLDQEFLDLAWSPNGKVLALATANGVTLYEPVSLTPTRFITSITSLALTFSPDSQSLLVGGGDNVVRLWNISNSDVQLQFEGHTASVTDVAIDTRGELFASSSEDNSVRIWEAMSGVERHILEGHSDWVLGVTFSPDGRWLVSVSRDKSVRIWDVKTGDLVHVFHGHAGTVTSVAITPDSRLLASGSEDGTVRLWDMVNMSEAHVLKGHLGGVTSVVFNPDGRLLASGGRDGTVRLWDVHTGVELRTLEEHAGEVLRVTFDPYGYWLASGGDNGKVQLWGVR